MKSALSYRCENEASRRLYRGATEAAQRLENTLNQISNFHNLFSPEVTDLRTRLKDYCERLMFTDPVAYGKKAEELLWRKVYYEFFQKCKQNKKKLLESEYHHHNLRSHLSAAIGSYHHMLLRIQTEFHVDLNAKVDVPFLWHLKGVKKERWKKYQQSAAEDDAVKSWATHASHRILNYLGDLARYISELQPEGQPPEPENSHLAQRYYLQAFCLNPKSGSPHNQLASLANNRFDSAYHYLRCLSSSEKFDAAEGNLVRIFEKNSQVIQELESSTGIGEKKLKCKMFLAKFLKLCEVFYFTTDESLQKYCQEALQDFDACIVPEDDDLGDNANSESSSDISYLDDERVFKVAVMCMMCIAKLHERGSSDVSTATAFTLALFSSIIHSCIKQLQMSVFENYIEEGSTPEQDIVNDEQPSAINMNSKTTEEIKNKMNEVCHLSSGKKGSNRKNTSKFNSKRLRKMRRRRKISSTSQEDSEISDVEVLELADESDEENDVLNSDVSQTGSCSSESLSEHEDLLNMENNNLENESKSTNESFSSEVYISAADSSDKENMKKDDLKRENDIVNDDGEPQSLANGCARILVSPERVADVLTKSSFMPTLKVLVDWLQTHKEVLKLCAESLQFLLSCLTALFNLFLKLEIQLVKFKESLSMLKRSGKDWTQVIPLPEDILLQNLPGREGIHSHFVYDISKRRNLDPVQMVYLRMQCMLSFGDHLSSSSEALISFHKERNEYILRTFDLLKEKSDYKTNEIDDQNSTGNNVKHQRQQLMHEMAHLWLKSEVNHLEMSVKSSASPQLSPLLVADTSALCHHLPLIKQLIAAKNFVVIVPKVVIDNLDQLKKKSIGAREAIRWLEFIFQKGSRHVRTQRDGEKTGLHPMKYPKRKDKESWDYFQILECCSFLAQQQQQMEKSSCQLVTFLFGTNNHLPGNAAALAKSLNISMENVESFFAKWRSSLKKPG